MCPRSFILEVATLVEKVKKIHKIPEVEYFHAKNI